MSAKILIDKDMIRRMVYKSDIWQIRAYALAAELKLRGVSPQRTMEANKTELIAYLLNAEEMLKRD